jgi:hypothetical protein
MSKRKTNIILGFGVFTLAIVLIFGSRARLAKARIDAASTEGALLVFGEASSNYYYLARRWPASIDELFTNSMQIRFVDARMGRTDAWGHPVEYLPFDPGVRYGSVKSGGPNGDSRASGRQAIEVRFASTNVWLVHGN